MYIYEVKEVHQENVIMNDYVVRVHGEKVSLEEYLTEKEQEAVWDFSYPQKRK